MTMNPSPVSSPQSLSPGSTWRSLWSLDPNVAYLNHGSFGACPIAVLEKQNQLRAQLEAGPVRFFEDQLEPLLDAARQELADFVGASPAELAFVPNATTGVNTVLRSLKFRPGDELLTTNQEYNASRNALDFAAQQSGATVVVAEVPFPIASADRVLESVLVRVSSRTRLVLIDHITSQTGLVFPLEALVRELTNRNIDVLVDGAHAPGMIPLNLHQLGVTYYTGNCHKWLCAPKGAAFLYVRAEQQSSVRPLVISHGANSPRDDRSRFLLEFDWTGTTDPTPYLCIPAAIQFMGSLLPEGWTGVMTHNHRMALAARQQLGHELQVAPVCPDSMIGAMAVLPLPPGAAKPLQTRLFQRFRIEVPVIPWPTPPARMIRISAQIYNTVADYDGLTRALSELLTMEHEEA